MRILLSTRVLLTMTVLITVLLIGSTESNPERGERDRKRSSANVDMMDRRFNSDHDIHDGDHLHEDDPYGHHSGGIGLDPDSHLPSQGVCEPIKVALCMGIGYNQTTMPNLVGHDAQADADTLLQTFSPLIQYGCSPHLKLFLCSAHVPMCTDKVPQPIGPCRSLCESVRSKCEPVLKEFGFAWPQSLECSKFVPENNLEHMCNPGPMQNHYPSKPGPGHSGFYPQPSNPRERFPQTSYSGVDHSGNTHTKESPQVPVIRVTNAYDPKSVSVPFVPSVNTNHHPIPRTFDPSVAHGGMNNNYPVSSSKNADSFNSANSHNKQDSTKNEQSECSGPRKVWTRGSCWMRCSAGSLDSSEDLSSGFAGGSVSLFHPSEKVFARDYALLWAVLSLSAAMIALTLSLCSPRFSVAERPILYLALCQVLFSIGVIIGSTSSVSCFVDKSTGSNLLARGGMIPSSCALVFLLTYFFGTATTMWWVILCLSWLLSLNRDVASSLLHKEWSLFHLVSWGVASILTSTALVHKKVDADELTGICGVGFQDMEALSWYNMIPLTISLSLGLVFLFVGLVARIFFPEWNLPVCEFRFLKRKDPTSGQNRMAGCELSNNSAATTTASHQTGQTHTHLQNSFRAPHGYSPVLVLPPHPPSNGLHGYSNCNMDRNNMLHHGHHYPGCMSSNGVVGTCGMVNGTNNNNALYSTGNSPASVVGVGGMQRLRALENTKAIWMRIGIFALVHSLPIACQVGTMAYELSGREDWESGKERPNLQIFLLRINMNLIAGLTTGVWVLSTYSWKSLSTFIRRFCTCILLPQTKKTHPHEQKLAVPSSVVAPLLTNNSVNVNHHNHHSLPPIPVPSGSSSSSNNHNSTMPILSSNNTFTVRGALAPHHITGGGPRAHFNYPLPPVPPRNPPDHVLHQQRTDAWRRGETIV